MIKEIRTMLPVTMNEGLSVQAVSSKDLYNWLTDGGNGQYARWSKKNILNNNFAIENEDYMVLDTVSTTSKGGKVAKEYALTLDFAKKLAMTSQCSRGEQAREYFLECERIAKSGSLTATGIMNILSSPENAAILLTEYASVKQQLSDAHDLIEAQMPSVEYCQRTDVNDGWLDVSEVAKRLHIKGLGPVKLMAFLRSIGDLFYKRVNGKKVNMPIQKLIDKGYYRLYSYTLNTNDGKTRTVQKPQISDRGQQHIMRMWMRNNALVPTA